MVENFSNEYLTKIVANNRPVDAINGIGPKYKRKLDDIGIRTTNDLLKRALRAKNRRALFSETDLSLTDLYEWAGMASLMIVNGIGPENAEILNRAGIENLGQLANQSSTAAVKKIERLKERKPKVVKRKPSQKTLASWIDEARILFDELELQKSDIEGLTPATLRELDYKIHDLLNFQSWKSFIQLGNSLQGLANFKIREFRIQQQLWEKLQEVNNRSKKFDKYQDQLKNPNITEIIKNHLAEMGESKKDIAKFIKELKHGKLDKYGPKNDLGNFTLSKDKCKFVIFIGTLGAYLNILGKINGYPKPEKDFITTVMDHKVQLEEIRDLVPEEENIEITQKDIDSIHDTIHSKLLDPVRKQVNEIETEIDEILKDIYGCLVAKKLEKLEKTTAVNLWRLDEQFEKFFRITYRTLPLLYRTLNPPAEDVRLAVKLSALLERQVILYGICLYFLALNYNSRLGASSILEEEINKAKKAVFESQLPKRDFVPLSELLEETNRFKNSVIETCGKVKLTMEWRKSDKVGFILQQNGKQVDVILKGCEAKNILPPEDSFVLLSGELKNTRKELIIEVEKFNFESLKKQSWLDHIMKLNNDYWYSENYVIKSDRFLRFSETARWIIRMYRRSK